MHRLGPVKLAKGGAAFRVEQDTCPLDTIAAPWWHALQQDWLATRAFPAIPLRGTSLDDYDSWTLDALQILQSEEPFIQAACASE